MKDPSSEFIRVALAQGALRFGEFTLKSGRRSPYFFNAGAINTGGSLAALGRCYAAAIDASGIAFDVLFGPAYKGIPLACAAAIALSEQPGRDVPCAFNRKEEKAHGEGGSLIGAPLGGQRVVIVDDVITAGTAVREVVELIRGAGASIAGVVIGLDRDEIGPGGRSAVAEIAEELGAPLLSIARLDDVVRYVEANEVLRGHLPAMREYRERWGAGG